MAAAVDFFDVPTSLKFECLAKGFLFEKGPGPQEDKDAKGQKVQKINLLSLICCRRPSVSLSQSTIPTRLPSVTLCKILISFA